MVVRVRLEGRKMAHPDYVYIRRTKIAQVKAFAGDQAALIKRLGEPNVTAV